MPQTVISQRIRSAFGTLYRAKPLAGLRQLLAPLLDLKKEQALLKARLEYLEYTTSKNSSFIRYLLTDIANDLPFAAQTRSSFDFQWDKMPLGRFNLNNALFRKEVPGLVCQFTDLSKDWFQGKSVIDVGCGAGRYSWAMSSLGAHVLSVDQSAHGLDLTKKAHADFSHHRTKEVNLLAPLEIDETFDLVWSYGVLHHTGNTFHAFQQITPLVKPGGYIFLMLYGEPRSGNIQDYAALNEYEYWRRRTQNLSLDQKFEVVSKALENNELAHSHPENLEGYFDAISPPINDTYTWEEIEGWLINAGFEDVRRTIDNVNHHVIARRTG